MTYTLSFYRPGQIATLRRRPWWDLFGQDTLESKAIMTRIVYHDVPEDEAKLIMQACNSGYSTTQSRLIKRLLGPDVDGLQLEYGSKATPYISTNK